MKKYIYEILIELSNIIFELKRVFNEGATETEYHFLCARMRNNLHNEKLISQFQISEYQKAKTKILEMHEYPIDYSFDFDGKGPSHIRYGIVFN